MRQMLGKILHDFYCLNLSDAILLLAAAAWCFLLLKKYFVCRRWWKPVVSAALLACLAVIVYTTLLNRSGNASSVCQLVPFHSYREAQSSGNEEIYRSNFMNVALFVPAGLLGYTLLPECWPRWSRIALAVLVFASFSVGIEYIQYTHVLGRPEIDDVIHNSLGSLLGSAAGILPLPQKTADAEAADIPKHSDDNP